MNFYCLKLSTVIVTILLQHYISPPPSLKQILFLEKAMIYTMLPRPQTKNTQPCPPSKPLLRSTEATHTHNTILLL